MNFDANLAAFNLATAEEVYDTSFVYSKRGWMIDAIETQETIEQFEEASALWAERTTPKRGTFAGMPYIFWSKVQTRSGARRRKVCVVDFGDCRMALDFDPSDFQ
jgi:hypothetical protein